MHKTKIFIILSIFFCFFSINYSFSKNNKVDNIYFNSLVKLDDYLEKNNIKNKFIKKIKKQKDIRYIDYSTFNTTLFQKLYIDKPKKRYDTIYNILDKINKVYSFKNNNVFSNDKVWRYINKNSCASLNKKIDKYFLKKLGEKKNINLYLKDNFFYKFLGCKLYKTEKKVSLSTYSDKYRRYNIKQAFKYIENKNKFLYPNEVMSVAKITYGSEYKSGFSIINGKEKKVYAGGICGISTIFHKACLKGLDNWCKIEEQNNHSIFYSNLYGKPGVEATIFWGSTPENPPLDYKFRNITNYKLYIKPFFNYNKNGENKFTYGLKLYSFSPKINNFNKISSKKINKKNKKDCYKISVKKFNTHSFLYNNIYNKKNCYKKMK